MKFTNVLGDLYDEVSYIWTAMGKKFSTANNFLAEIRQTPSRRLMEEIFELRRGEYISWKRKDLVCRDCWLNLIADTIPTWWAERHPAKMSESYEE